MTIYKYTLDFSQGSVDIKYQVIKILGVFHDPYGETCLYVLVDPKPLIDNKKFSTIYVFWTGRELPKDVLNWTHLTTLAIKGDLMCHYFLEEPK